MSQWQRKKGGKSSILKKDNVLPALKIGNLTLYCVLDRTVLKYDNKKIVVSASGTDYEEFRSHFAGW